MTNQAKPSLSVVIPVRSGAAALRETLIGLAHSDLPRADWELIVVLDAAEHECAEVAAESADLLIRLPHPTRGPAYARNRGAELARGETVLFLDADIRIRPETLRKIITCFHTNPRISAVFGSYDDTPPASGVVSQYRNLLRHFQHQRSGGEVAAFWAGCGAIRRHVFLGAGMFDEWRFSRPESEDLDLGRRLHARGHRIVLDPSLQVTHLKRWTLGSSLLTSLRDRGLSFMRTVGGDERPKVATATNWLNSDRASAICTALAAVLAAAAFVTQSLPLLQLATFVLLLGVVAQAELFSFFVQLRGIEFGMVAVPIHVLHDLCSVVGMGLGWVLRHLVGGPHRDPLTEAYAELGLQTWPPVPRRVLAATSSSHANRSIEVATTSNGRNDSAWLSEARTETVG